MTGFGKMENDREGLSAVQMILEGLIQHYAGGNSLVYSNDERRVTIIFGLDSFEQEERLEEICKCVIGQMKGEGYPYAGGYRCAVHLSGGYLYRVCPSEAHFGQPERR